MTPSTRLTRKWATKKTGDAKVGKKCVKGTEGAPKPERSSYAAGLSRRFERKTKVNPSTCSFIKDKELNEAINAEVEKWKGSYENVEKQLEQWKAESRRVLNTDCMICQDKIHKHIRSSFPCGHEMHMQCFMDYNRRGKKDKRDTCPVCRTRFPRGI